MNRNCMMLFTGVSLLAGQACAENFPKGCEPRDYRFTNNHLALNETGTQRLFIIYNQSTFPVEMQRRRTSESFMSPSLSVTLGPQSWSAFASDLQNLEFECHLTLNENTQKVNCAQYLQVCEYPRAKFALSNMGNYWVSANKGQRDVINDAAARGIYLHW